jgi:hypothetical protein
MPRRLFNKAAAIRYSYQQIHTCSMFKCLAINLEIASNVSSCSTLRDSQVRLTMSVWRKLLNLRWAGYGGDAYNGFAKEEYLTIKSILWRSIYLPGHEACRLFSQGGAWQLAGTSVFSHNDQPCRLDYQVVWDASWNTTAAKVSGWLGPAEVEIELTVDPEHNCRLNGVERPAVAGCIDLDLNFSPSTNLLPIRRLNLAVAEEAEVKAAWLRFPTFELEPLFQIYRRIDESTYRYESGGGTFVADLEVDGVGFVTNYPGIWQAEAVT